MSLINDIDVIRKLLIGIYYTNENQMKRCYELGITLAVPALAGQAMDALFSCFALENLMKIIKDYPNFKVNFGTLIRIVNGDSVDVPGGKSRSFPRDYRFTNQVIQNAWTLNSVRVSTTHTLKGAINRPRDAKEAAHMAFSSFVEIVNVLNVYIFR